MARDVQMGASQTQILFGNVTAQVNSAFVLQSAATLTKWAKKPVTLATKKAASPAKRSLTAGYAQEMNRPR